MADRTIYITGLAPVATEKDLKDLFSFCGNLLRITIRSGGGDTNDALIEFDAASALDMALQFSNALVKGKTIMVYPYSESPEFKIANDQKKQSSAQNSPKSMSPVGSPPNTLSIPPPNSANNLTNTTLPANSPPKNNTILVEPKKVSKSIIDEDVFNFDDFPPNSIELKPKSNAAPNQSDDLANKNNNEPISSPNSSQYNSMSPTATSPRDSLNLDRLSLSSNSALRTILITDLDPHISPELFFKFFDFCGPMLSYAIDTESSSAMIEFRSQRALKIAAHLNQCNLGAKKVQIESFDLNKHSFYFDKLGPLLQTRPSEYDDNSYGSETVSPSTSPVVSSMLAISPPKQK